MKIGEIGGREKTIGPEEERCCSIGWRPIIFQLCEIY
jgi:hypothetical protein